MIIRNVPFITQSSSNSCLLASLEIVLKLHQIYITQNQIEKDIPIIPDSNEYHIANLGIFALRQGLKATIYCYDFTNIFSKLHEDLPHHTLLKKFTLWVAKSKENLKYRMPYLQFLEQGGDLQVSLPTNKTLQDCIDKGTPPIILIEARSFFGDAATKDAGHSVVVIGYDQDSFIVHDPFDPSLPHAKGKSVKIPKDQLLFCWYRRYGNMLIVHP